MTKSKKIIVERFCSIKQIYYLCNIIYAHILLGTGMRQRALRAFSRLPLVVAEAREALLAYCHLDTLAMVRVWEKLKKIV